MTWLSLSGINKAYPNQEVLRDLSLDIDQGTVAAICGASGTGKSTLLNILGLLDQPDSGSYTLGDTAVDKLKGDARNRFRASHIGFIFQGFHLLPEFDVLENIIMPARCARRGASTVAAHARELLTAVGLADKANGDIRTLSGGEAQRIALCRALLLKPPLILADEPTGNLDPATATVVLHLLLDLARTDGSTVIIVTHDQKIAAQAELQLELRDGDLQAGQIDA